MFMSSNTEHPHASTLVLTTAKVSMMRYFLYSKSPTSYDKPINRSLKTSCANLVSTEKYRKYHRSTRSHLKNCCQLHF